MEDFIVNKISTPEEKTHQAKPVSTNKKLRRTQDLFNFFSTSDEESDKKKAKAVRSTRTCKNLFLPRIEDTEIVSSFTPSTAVRDRSSLLKRKQALKLLQRKIESKGNRLKRPTRIATEKTIFEHPNNKSPKFIKELYIPLIPLEKTDLLKIHQCRKVTMPLQRTFSAMEDPDLTLLQNNLSSSDSNLSLLRNCRPCRVILERLPLNQIITSPRKLILATDNRDHMQNFIPILTSSPCVSPQLSDSVYGKWVTEESSKNSSRLGQSLKSFYNSNSATSSSSPNEFNGTYTISNPNNTNITFRRSRLQTKVNTTNASLEVTPRSSFDMPKSALKSKDKCADTSRRPVQRVTFSDTSVIIIDDISDTSSSNTSYSKSYVTPKRVTFPIEDSDEENAGSPQYNKCSTVGHTPFYRFNNSPSSSKSVSSSDKSLLLDLTNTAKKFSKVKKMPNFALLHKKLFNNMLDIEEHSRRQQERAQLLLSGKKCRVSTPLKKNSVTPQNQLLQSSNDTSGKRTRTNNADVSVSTHKVINSRTRFGFSSQTVANISKKEQIAAVSNKTRPLKSRSQSMRVEIKGVRSNRRFDLLMNMRLNKK